MRGIRALLFMVIVASAQAARSQDNDVVRLRIDAGEAGTKIDRHIFGQFAEHLGRGIYEGIWVGPGSTVPNTRGIRNDVVAALKELKVPVVRWPGGCFADEYHWRKGIGPADKRPATLNPNWGGVIEPNTFGTHEFLDFAQQIGADAYVSVNVGSGTPQEAAEWLEYLTADKPSALAQERAANGHPDPYKIAFLGIGNESWGCGGTMSPEYYLSQLKIYSHYARNYNGAEAMQRIAVGPDGGDTGYTETIMKAWQSKVWSWDIEGLSLHSYTVGKWPPSYKSTGFGEPEYAALLKETLRMEELIQTHSTIMDAYDPQKKIGLMVDEWGVWLAPTPGTNPGFLEQQNSQRDAIIAALNINIFARHADRVRMANVAQDDPHADLPRLSHVRAFSGCAADTHTLRRGQLRVRHNIPAAGGCDRSQGQERQALAGTDQRGSQSRREGRGHGRRRETGRRPNAVLSQSRQRQHLRVAGHGGP
jgi:alpha-L-arabinofuranosidase